MTSNAQILARADEVAELIREKIMEHARDIMLTTPRIVPPGGNIGAIPPDPIDVQEWQDKADAAADRVRPNFEWFTEPDPQRISTMLDSLQYVLGNLRTPMQNPAIGYVDQVRTYVAGWTGDAADAFNLNFLSGFPATRHNQIGLVGELAAVLQGWEAILNEGRIKIMEIGDNTIAALTALPGGGLSLPVALAIGAAVVGAITAAVSGGASVTLPLALLGGGLAVGAQVASEVMIGGSTAESVAASMHDAIERLKMDMLNAEIILVNILRHDAGLLADAQAQAARKQMNYLVLWPPTVIAAIGGDVDFQYPR